VLVLGEASWRGMKKGRGPHGNPRSRRLFHQASHMPLGFTTDILRTLNPMLKQCYTDPAMVRHFSSALGEAINLAVSRGVQ